MINSNVSYGTFLGKTISVVPTIPGKPVTGQMFFDVANSQYLIYTGSNWVEITNATPILNIPGTVRVEDLCETHPGLKELKQQRDEAQEKFDAFLALVKEHHNVDR